MVNKPRIYQILRRSGIINTKSDALNLLKERAVKVDGRIISNPNFQLNPKKETITIREIPLSLEIQKKYFILNKPTGYITSKKPSLGKKYVMELIHTTPPIHNTLFPVGRLDVETSGLMIITNDGALAHSILQPKKNIEKEYLVTINSSLTEQEKKKLSEGITIKVKNQPYKTLPSKINVIKQSLNSTEISITLIEGKKRQVRLMIAALGHKVLSLKRIRIGNLLLSTLRERESKELKEEEIRTFIFS